MKCYVSKKKKYRKIKNCVWIWYKQLTIFNLLKKLKKKVFLQYL